MKQYYPIMLNIANKKCIIVGGGNVALRKAKTLLEYTKQITIISECLCDELSSLILNSGISWVKRNYTVGDINNTFLVVAATNNKTVNHQVYEEAKSKNILINVIDEPELCDFIVPSKVEVGDLTIAISTDGKSPALAKKIRKDLETVFGEEYAKFLNLLGEIRTKAIVEIEDNGKRSELFEKLVYSDVLSLLKEGNDKLAEEEIDKIYREYIKRD